MKWGGYALNIRRHHLIPVMGAEALTEAELPTGGTAMYEKIRIVQGQIWAMFAGTPGTIAMSAEMPEMLQAATVTPEEAREMPVTGELLPDIGRIPVMSAGRQAGCSGIWEASSRKQAGYSKTWEIPVKRQMVDGREMETTGRMSRKGRDRKNPEKDVPRKSACRNSLPYFA